MELIGKVLIHMYGLVLEWGLGRDEESDEIVVLISRNFVRLDLTVDPTSEPVDKAGGQVDITGQSGVLFYNAGTPLVVAARIADLIVEKKVTYSYQDLKGNQVEPVKEPVDWAIESKLWKREHARVRSRRQNGVSLKDKIGPDKSPF